MIQERPLQYARKAYSRTLKGMFLNQKKHVESLRRVKILTYSKRGKVRKGRGKEHRDYTIRKRSQHLTQLGTTTSTAGPSPTPPPKGRGVITEIPM